MIQAGRRALLFMTLAAAIPATGGPAFEIADVHLSSPGSSPMQGGVLNAGRYELRRATMLDLIKAAYEVDADVVSGGPSWLELDRYDVIARAPADTRAETVRIMLQSLLADRFKLVVHKDSKPIAGFVLTVGKGNPKMKEASGSGPTGCEDQPRPRNSTVIPPRLVDCRNVTMEEFARALRELDGGYLTGPVLNQTGLKGSWSFDLQWNEKRSIGALDAADVVTIFAAVDEQLGLKLEPGAVPMPVIVVDSVNEKPTPNSPRVAVELPPLPPPKFEVASIRPSSPGERIGGRGFMPGGRVDFHGLPLAFLMSLALDPDQRGDQMLGAPKWLKPFEPSFDLVAKAPATSTTNGTELYQDDYAAMIRSLLTDRFKLVTHYENRPTDAYTLVAAKPKLKAANPSSRTRCKTTRAAINAAANAPPAVVVTCQNTTMAQFAEQLQAMARSYLRYPVLDATGIAGAWDFTLSFSPVPPNDNVGGAPGGVRGGGPVTASSDPVGGTSLFEAVDKQLGLKLERHQRPEPVLVIDHIEEKPTEN